MKRNNTAFFLSLLLVLWIKEKPVYAGNLHTLLAKSTRPDSVCTVWVLFSEKSNLPGATGQSVTRKARRRRINAGFPVWSSGDVPIPKTAVESVRNIGARLRHTFKWANAASFDVPVSLLKSIVSLPGVEQVIPVRSLVSHDRKVLPGLKKSFNDAIPDAHNQLGTVLSMLNVPRAHNFLAQNGFGTAGTGVVIGFLDNGFYLAHQCLSSVTVLADSDFVDNDGDVRSGDGHGSQTLALIAGDYSGSFSGIAPWASFVLARTEEDIPERHTEEDSWAAAVVWAESLGVDIINSSLGYRYFMEDTVVIDGMPVIDYSFDHMDGKSTIVSLAADSAVRRGMIIVNSMGNDYVMATPTLNAPADVPGVVSVGSIDMDSTHSFFSSNGPNADNVIKPDCVTPGNGIPVPDPFSIGDYVTASGTSLSAPLVAGICALILQAHPGIPAERVRAYLYASCSLMPTQNTIDSLLGRGIPDALLACSLNPNQAVVLLRDSLRITVPHVRIVGQENGAADTTDAQGIAVLDVDTQTLPDTFYLISANADVLQPVIVSSVPSRINATMNPASLYIQVRTDSVKTLTGVGNASIAVRSSTGRVQERATTDSTGNALLFVSTPGRYPISISIPGYIHLDTTANFTRSGDTLMVILTPRPAGDFIVYPTVLEPGEHLTFEFLASPDAPRSYTQGVSAAIRSLDGSVVWTWSTWAQEYRPVTAAWNGNAAGGVRVNPGTYIFLLRYAEKTYTRKIVVK